MAHEPAEARRTAIEAAYPQSPLQTGMLFHHLYGAASGVDIQQIVAHLREPLSVPLFEQAWQQTIARHPALRTAFRWDTAEGLRQEIHREVACPLAFEDWRALLPAEQDARWAAFCRDDLRRGFALDQPPLMRLSVFQCADADFRFVWTFHHALIDGRSYDLLLREVFTIYEALGRGETYEPPMSRPYRDYILWLQEQDVAASQNFWRELLAGVSAPTPLPDVPSTVALSDGNDYGMHELWLPEELTAALAEMTRAYGLSVSTLIQGAWALLLSRMSGEDDVVVGVTRTVRHSALGGNGADSMIGLLINTLPARARMTGRESTVGWLQGVRAQSIAVRAHEHSPLASIHEWSHLPGGMALFDSIVVFENYRLDTRLKALGGSWANRDFDVFGRTSYPLTLLAYQDERLLLRLKYERPRFDDNAIRRMLDHLASILTQFVAAPHQPLDAISLLTQAEAQQILVEWNGPPGEAAEDTCFHEAFEAQVARTPDAPAVAYEDTRLSYRQLNSQANRLARCLRAQGVGAETVVGIYLDRSVETVVALLGILKASGAYLPLDAGLPTERLALMIEEAHAAALVTTRAILGQLPDFAGSVVCLDEIGDAGEVANLPNLARPANLAYVLFTSGSTGRPKGVAIEHRQVMSYLSGILARLDLPPAASYALVSTFAADLGNTMIFPSLTTGGCLHVIAGERAASPDALADYFARHAIDCLKIVPSHLAALLSADEPARVLPRQRLILGGEAATPALVTRVQALAPQCRIFNHYGPTETTVGVLTHPIDDMERIIPLGRPLPNTRVYILDTAMQPAPVGIPGELYIGGDQVARGYIHRPDLTAERFVPNPHAGPDRQAARLYRTGDRVRWRDDGAVEFLGRTDDQVKIRGYRVEPSEVAVTLAQHPAVTAAVALAVEDERGEKRLAAYVVPSDLNSADDLLPSLMAFLRQSLPEHMLPSAIVPVDALPLTANGKIDRRALPAPRFVPTGSAIGYVAPRTDVEATLAAIWEEILGLERVGVHDNFFELGGDSIASIRVLARAHRAGFRLTPRIIFEHPTIAELAARIAPPITGAEALGRSVPLTPYQRLLLRASSEGETKLWSGRLLRARETLDQTTLVAAVQGLVAHHDALRLRVRREGSGWQAWVTDSANAVMFTRERLNDTSQTVEEAIDRLAPDIVPANGDLFRVGLFETEDHASVVALVAHTLIADAPSWPILIADLATAYQQAQRGEPIHLPPSPSFSRWAERLSRYAETEAAAQRSYWQSLASPAAAVRTEKRNRRDDVLIFLSEEDTRTVLAESQAAYRTQPEEMLLAALTLALAQRAEGDSCLAEIAVDARTALPDVDATRSVGVFSAAFPFRLDLHRARGRGQDDVGAVLLAIKEELRRVPDRGIGYGALQDELNTSIATTIGFRYLGVVDKPLAENKLWETVAPLGELDVLGKAAYGDETAREVNVVAWVEGERLALAVGGSGTWDMARTRSLADALFHELKTLAYYCVSIGAHHYTPSDFPDAGLSQDDLDELLSSL